VSLSLGGLTPSGDVGHLIVNDGLMTLFFFDIGLEIKREIVLRELRDPRKALLPEFAALGGVVVQGGHLSGPSVGRAGAARVGDLDGR
jgi:NhaA family Na+:H+ antiporter